MNYIIILLLNNNINNSNAIGYELIYNKVYIIVKYKN